MEKKHINFDIANAEITKLKVKNKQIGSLLTIIDILLNLEKKDTVSNHKIKELIENINFIIVQIINDI